MAIEKLSEVTFVVRKNELKNFRNYLCKLGIIHIRDVSSLSEPPKVDLNEEMLIREDLSKVEYILKVINEIIPEKQSFIENFVPKRPIFTQEEIDQIKEDFNLQAFYSEIKGKFEEKKIIEEKITFTSAKIKDLEPFKNINLRFDKIRKYKKVRVLFFYSSNKSIKDFLKYNILTENSLILEVPKDNELFGFIFIIPDLMFNEINNLLKKIGLLEIDFSELEGIPLENIKRFKEELTSLENKKNSLKSELKELCSEKNKIILFSDILKSGIFKCEIVKAFASSKRVSLIEGYIPSLLEGKFIKFVEENYPHVYFEVREAKRDLYTPVKLRNNEFFKPFEFIIKMFGQPKYGDIDPTPFIAVTFLILFGIAFGDLLYGLFLSLICLFFMKKYSFDKGVVNFVKLFYYSGLSAAFFGAITGSWGGDLISDTYLSPNNSILRIKNTLTIIDPLKDIMTMLVSVIILGIVNQMYGVFIAMLSNIRDRNFRDAIFDQLSWLIFVPGAVITAGNFLAPNVFPANVIDIGYKAMILGLIMIFLGGFLKSTSIINRMIKGFLNIYGIISSYGISSFLSDTLSYLRLFALMLATSSMAMSFNLIAFMFKDMYLIGPILVILLLFITHLINLLLSILGAFVHPVRLLFYEFFGRFYSNGGEEFKAFSEIRKSVIIKEEDLK